MKVESVVAVVDAIGFVPDLTACTEQGRVMVEHWPLHDPDALGMREHQVVDAVSDFGWKLEQF